MGAFDVTMAGARTSRNPVVTYRGTGKVHYGRWRRRQPVYLYGVVFV